MMRRAMTTKGKETYVIEADDKGNIIVHNGNDTTIHLINNWIPETECKKHEYECGGSIGKTLGKDGKGWSIIEFACLHCGKRYTELETIEYDYSSFEYE